MSHASQGLAPVIDERVGTLILGSFPSVHSLARGQYYANPRNQFWKLVGQVIGEPLCDLPYARRIETLLAHRIGLWDVIRSCERDGSLDSRIRDPQANDLVLATRLAPGLRRVCFNGQKAGALWKSLDAQGMEVLVLPSSSAANTVAFAIKLAVWRGILRI